MRVVALIVFALLFSPSKAWLQARKPATVADLVNYMGADREQMLYAGGAEKFYYGSATRNRLFKHWRPERGLTTDKYEKEVDSREKLLKQMVVSSATITSSPSRTSDSEEADDGREKVHR